MRRLQMRQLIVTKYEEMMAMLPRELMALSAVLEPRLIQAIKDVTTKETLTACIGIFQPGVT
jgi:hypothetical protein